MKKKSAIFIHIIIMYLIFFLGEWIRMFPFRIGIKEPYDEILSVLMNISIVLFFIWIYSFIILRKPMKHFMFCKPLPKFKWCILAIVIPTLICFFYIYCLDGELQRNTLEHADLVYIFSYTILRTGICAGVVEELIFRGMIMNLLESIYSRKKAILFSSFLFATIHLGNIDTSLIFDTVLMLISITIAGIALSFVAYETGSIWSGVVIHGMYNIITSGQILEIGIEHNFSTIWNYTPDTRVPLLTGGDYGITAGIPTIIGFLCIISIAGKGINKKERQASKSKNSSFEEIDYSNVDSDTETFDINSKWGQASRKIKYVIGITLLVIALGCIFLSRICLNKVHVNDEIASVTKTYALTENEKKSIRKSERYQTILKQKTNYPARMIEDLERNPEMLDFVEQYENRYSFEAEGGEITQSEMNSSYPLFMQWDSRWGYSTYGNSIIGLSGCGPTCLSMVIFSLTGDINATPDCIARYSMDKGYYVEGVGTAWTLLTDAAEYYGITVNSMDILEEEEIKEYISDGGMIICSMGPGDFTDQGHFIVIRGYNDSGFVVNDPFSYTNSSHEWEYRQLAPQICQMWVYTLK